MWNCMCDNTRLQHPSPPKKLEEKKHMFLYITLVAVISAHI